LINNNYPITEKTKTIFLNELNKQLLSDGCKSQYKNSFNILISKYDNYFVEGIVFKDMVINDVPTLSVISNFIEKTNAGLKTAKRYNSTLNGFYRHYNIINQKNIKEYITNLTVKINTKKQYLRDLKNYSTFLYDYNYITKENFVEIKRLKIKGSEDIKKNILSKSEIIKLIVNSPDEHVLEIGLCYFGALRYYETSNYIDNGKYLEVNGKGSKTSTVAVSKELRLLLDNYKNVTDYKRFSKWLNVTCEDLFSKYITTHCLRASNAIDLYKNTKDIELVKRHLRHDNIETTSSYLKHIEDDDYLDKINIS
jgi:integrase